MRDRKNILFLTNRLPFPPNKGDKIRTFHQLDQLALSHNVYCACFVDSQRDMQQANNLKRWCKDLIALRWRRTPALIRAVAGWSFGRSLTERAYVDKMMFQQLTKWSQHIHFDAAVAFSSCMAPYALAAPARRRVLDMCDVDSEKWFDYSRSMRFPRSAMLRMEGRRLRAWEQFCLNAFDATIFITDRERRILDPSGGKEKLHVIPNGVRLFDRVAGPASQCGPVVGFLGAMNYRPNVEGICWFVKKVWPSVIQEIPEARLLIVGRSPARPVRRLDRVQGVTVTGEVPEIRTYLARCRIVVAPLQIARGMQNKVLEAMAARRPVVATPAVTSGLRALPGHHIAVAGSPGRFASNVLKFLRSEELCQEIGDAGYRCVATHYCWAETLQRYQRLVLGEKVTAAHKLRRVSASRFGAPMVSEKGVALMLPAGRTRLASLSGNELNKDTNGVPLRGL